jgi:hypothetical protein
MSTATVEKVGIAGSVNGYTVVVIADTIVVRRDDEERARHTVDGLGMFVSSAKDLRLGWGQFPDNAEVIFLHDKGDDCFGYAVNVDWADGSEWGYVPFAA